MEMLLVVAKQYLWDARLCRLCARIVCNRLHEFKDEIRFRACALCDRTIAHTHTEERAAQQP